MSAPPPPGRIGPNKAAVVLVRSGEKWLIEGIKESLAEPASYEHLKALDWMVGSWSTQKPGEASERAGSEKSAAEKAGAEKPAAEEKDQISINCTCQWTANKSFLTRTFDTRLRLLELKGMEVIAWDPQSKTIRSWLFESTGGFTQSAWKFDGKRWTIEMTGVLANGSTLSATTYLTKLDEDRISIQSPKRLRDGQPQPEIPATKLYRMKQ